MTELLLGDEAVAVAALDAGISGAFSYPGTPATEIMETVQQRGLGNPGVVARWSANEKVAYEQALGMSLCGKRAIVSMKHVGLNVAADPFINSALTGAHGGLVLAVADDPGMHSSQNEQDSRYYGDFAKIPVLEPCSPQEAYDMTREAFALSERAGLPVMLRLVTRLAHTRGLVERRPAPERPRDLRPDRDWTHWTLLPVNARGRYRRLLELQPALEEYAEKSPFNVLRLDGPRGIIATGMAWAYVQEVLEEDAGFSLLKIGCYPTPVGLIRRLVDHCNEVFVIEEGYPYVERCLRGIYGVPGRAIRGKLDGTLAPDGEMTADRVRVALGLAPLESLEAAGGLPPRPPQLCAGCPHGDTFRAVVDAIGMEEDRLLFSDIGCYTLGAFPPYRAVHTCVDMGASISMAHGAAKAGAHPVLCTIGDSTFVHTGIQPLIEAAHDNANMTVVILDNATVGMTGQQEVFATGERLVELVRACGVPKEHVIPIVPLPRFAEKNAEILRREIAYRGLSVIIAQRPCIHVHRRESERAREAQETAATG